ncbi:MAG: hypothetical protein RIK87_16435 [Fuerstiella sp.]
MESAASTLVGAQIRLEATSCRVRRLVSGLSPRSAVHGTNHQWAAMSDRPAMLLAVATLIATGFCGLMHS